MKRFWSSLAAVACISATVVAKAPLKAQAATYKSVPLDCGGWFSGFSVHSGGRLYGYGDVFGVWRSDNAGQTWRTLQGDFVNDVPSGDYLEAVINGMDVAKNNADILAFLTPTKMWRSSNGGTTWTALGGLTTNRMRGSTGVFYHPTNDSEIWLAAARSGLTGKLWRSTSGGTSWTKVGGTTFNSVTPYTIYVRKEFPDQVWVGTSAGLYVSANRGTSWTRVWNNGGANNPLTGAPSVVSAIVRRADGIGYVVTDVGGYRVTASNWATPSTYVFTKTLSWWDGWGPSNATVLANGSFVSGGDGDRNAGNINDLQDAQRISTDGGQTWAYLPLNLSSSVMPSWLPPLPSGAKADGGRDMIVQDPTNAARWFMTGGAAPVISNDSGNTWSFVPNNGGLAGVMTYKVRFSRNNSTPAFIPAADMGGFVVTDGGASGNVASSVRRTDTTMTTFHDIMSSDNGQVLVAAGVAQSSNVNYISRSTDGGSNWSPLDLSNSGLPNSYDGITRAVMAPGNDNDFLVLLSSDNPGLWRTTDGGASFYQANGLSASMDTGSRSHQENAYLETDGVNTNTRYLAARPNLFYRSTDGGWNWSQLAAPFGTDYVHGMAVDRNQAGKIWVAGGYRGLKTSNDGGNNWSDIAGFGDVYRVDAANGRVAVWGKRTGDTWFKIYYSPDNGSNWTEKTGTGGRFPFTRDIAVDPFRPGQVWVSGISVNVIDYTTTSSSTPTPTPISTPTPSADVTYSFNDVSAGGAAIDGVHGGINFGSGLWGGGDSWFGLTNCGYFTSDVSSRSFTLPAGKKLKSIKLSTEVANTTWSISDGVNTTRSGTLTAINTPTPVTTNWSSNASTVTITFSSGWANVIDDVVYG